MNATDNNGGIGYAPKMDNAVTAAMKDWWKGLSKEELLAYIQEQPSITADDIRNMMTNMNAVLAFDIRFSTMNNEAVTDFHIKP